LVIILFELLIIGENTSFTLEAIFGLIIANDLIHSCHSVYEVINGRNTICMNLGIGIYEIAYFLYYLMIWLFLSQKSLIWLIIGYISVLIHLIYIISYCIFKQEISKNIVFSKIAKKNTPFPIVFAFPTRFKNQ